MMEKSAFRILSVPQTGMYKLHRTPTVVNTAFKVYPDTQTGVHKLHRTSTVVKNAFSIHPETQAGMNKLHDIEVPLRDKQTIPRDKRKRASQDLHNRDNCFLN